MKSIVSITGLILILGFFMGCSQSNPIQPADRMAIPLSSADFQSSKNLSDNPKILGVWKIRIETVNLSSEILPSRVSSAIGDVFDTDLSQFLTISPCSNCLSIAGINLDDYGDLNIEFRIKHPFKNFSARPDLHGFDVRGIFITDYIVSPLFTGIDVLKPNGDIEPAFMPFGVMLNSDGYTSHYDNLVTDERYFVGGHDLPGNINPFLRFFQSSWRTEFDAKNPSGWNVMPVGSEYDSRIGVFSLGSIFYDMLEFYLVADVAYGQSSTIANRNNPQYYLPAFNRTEPWRIEYWIENNTLQAGIAESSADVVVQVFDWQHSASVDPDYPNPANPHGIPESSKVHELALSVPGMLETVLKADTPESGDGTPENPLQYRITVHNDHATTYNIMGLLAVRDELYGQSAPHGRLPVPESPSGFPIATDDIIDYSLYNEIWINFPSDDPSKFNNELLVESSTYTSQSSIRIEPTHFMDLGHTEFQYFWDFDYDGVTFDPDGYGLPSPSIPLEPGENIIGLGVVTHSVPPRQYAYKIPVIHGGEIFNEFISQNVRKETSSSALSNSITITDDHVYIAYAAKIDQKFDVYLATGNRDGSFTNVSATSSIPNDCLNPSMVVIEDDPNPGVYIVFEVVDNADFGLNSTYTNLTGTSFNPSNVRVVENQSSVYERKPCLVYDTKGRLITYFSSISLSNDIRIVHSDDYTDTWIPDGLTHQQPGVQSNPSAGYSQSQDSIFCVWEDFRDYDTRGCDLYLARSDDGVNFEPEICVSSKTGKFEHLRPSISVLDDQIGVVYKSEDLSSGTTDIILKVFDADISSMADFRITSDNLNYEYGKPSVSSCSIGKFQVVCSSFFTPLSTLKLDLVEARMSADISGFEKNVIWSIDLSDSQLQGYVNPAVAARPVYIDQYGRINGIEIFTSWTSFSDGYSEITLPEPMRLGKIQSELFVSSYY